jgi:penicillin V acylase-like amidase (Ntn superfamily)
MCATRTVYPIRWAPVRRGAVVCEQPEEADRFVRAAYYLKNLPKPADYRECVAGVLSVMQNAAQPFGTAGPARPNISATQFPNNY